MRQEHGQPKKVLQSTLWMLCDLLLVNIAMILAQLVRYSVDLQLMAFFHISFHLAPFMSLIFLASFALFGLYRTMWQYASAADALRIAAAAFTGAVFTFLFSITANHFFGHGENLFRLHRMVYLLLWIISYALIATSRLLYNLLMTKKRTNKLALTGDSAVRVMIIGADWYSANLIHEMQNGSYGNRIPVLLLESNRTDCGRRLSGVPVVHETDNLKKLTDAYRIDEIIITAADTAADQSQLFEKCVATDCKVKLYTPLQDMQNNQEKQMRDINISDLLGRPEEQLDMTAAADYFGGKTILITGGGGSIGSELCRRLLPLGPKQIVLYDISENYMYDLFNELKLQYGPSLKDKLVLCVASVQDPVRLDNVFSEYKPQVVLHAAAHKHVPLMEDCPDQAVKNNVFGTYKTAIAAIQHGVERFVLISTDKAVNPTNVMGATKRIAEIIVEALNSTSETEFMAVRFGNVLGSHGSVVPLFQQQILAGGPITLTHPEIIRYFMTIPEAASLVLQAATLAKGGELFALDMGKPIKIRDLAEQMIRLYAPRNESKIEIVYTGLRKGEKLYEEILLAEEGMESTPLEKIFVTRPKLISSEDLQQILNKLQNVLDQNGDMMACLHEILPNFRNPEAVNAEVRQGEIHA